MSEDPRDVGDDIKYDPATETYTATFEGRPSGAVIDVIAAIVGDAATLDPLYFVLDPDALDRLVAHRAAIHRHGDLSITFDYHGYEVTVHRFGVVRVAPPAEDTPNREPVND